MIIEVEIRERKVWRNAIFALTIILLSIFVLYLSTFIGMVSIWERSETFTHGFLVLPITLWLIWRKRTLLALRQPKPDFLLIIPIFLTSLIWLLGDLVAINSVTQLAVICLIVLSVFPRTAEGSADRGGAREGRRKREREREGETRRRDAKQRREAEMRRRGDAEGETRTGRINGRREGQRGRSGDANALYQRAANGERARRGEGQRGDEG